MKPMKDYSFIRGFCYGFGYNDPGIWDRELAYARRLQLNSTRIWLNYKEYEENPSGYIEKLVAFTRLAWSKGISTQPILWNGNGIDPCILQKDFRAQGEKYVRAVVDALKDEEGLIMWDIMNEPTCNDYIIKASEGEVKKERLDIMWTFVRHFCEYVKSLDPVNAITVGNTYIWDTEPTAGIVDVISFHDYSPTRARIEKVYKQAMEYSAKYGKPVINNETACLCRANPYDIALEISMKYKVGWYLFELMIHGYWGDVHGIVYPDGTVRDPSIVAAIFGFFRNRTGETIRPKPNKESNATAVLAMVKEALDEEAEVFRAKKRSAEELLEAAEYCANLLEGCEMVPMIDPPSSRILKWRASGHQDIEEISAFTYELVQLLKKYCQIM